MAGGEVRYRLTLDHEGFKRGAQEAAASWDKFEKQTKNTSASLGEFSNRLGQVSTTLARSADAFGLNANAMRTLNDVADVAELGFQNLNKGVAGFNVASIGAAGAGLALGTAIGTLAREHIPGLASAMDDVVNVFAKSDEKLAAATVGLSEFTKKIQAMKAENMKLRPPISDDDIKKIVKAKEELEKMNKARAILGQTPRDLADAERVLRIAGASSARASVPRRAAPATKAPKPYDFSGELPMGPFQPEKPDSLGGGQNLYSAALFAMQGNVGVVPQIKAADKATTDWSKHLQDVANAFQVLGISANSVLGRVVGGLTAGAAALDSFKKGGGVQGMFKGGVGGFLSQLTSGLGVVGAGVNIGKSIFGALFGGGEGKKVNDMRDQFISASGGLDALRLKAHEAGMTLDQLLRADRVSEFESAVQGLTGAFDTHAQAQKDLQAAAERYGLTLAEMGPKFAQGQLDKQAAGLLKDWELLTAAGANHQAVLDKMGPAFNAYVNEARAAGLSLPENLRGVVEQLIRQGKLLDENGNAFTSVEQAGLSFTMSLTQGLSAAVDAINRLVAALGGAAGAAAGLGGGLRDLTGGGGEFQPSPAPLVMAAKGYGPAIVPNVGRGLGPLIQTHAGEGVAVIPAHLMRSGKVRMMPRRFHAAAGFGRGGPGEGGGYGGATGGSAGYEISQTPSGQAAIESGYASSSGGGGGGSVATSAEVTSISTTLTSLTAAIVALASQPAGQIISAPQITVPVDSTAVIRDRAELLAQLEERVAAGVRKGESSIIPALEQQGFRRSA